jgi:type VI secretion system secreted protein VgrG
MTNLSVKTNNISIFIPWVLDFLLVASLATSAIAQSPAPVPLASAADFAVLAATMVTSGTPPPATVLYGDLGIFPGSTLDGAPTVNGTTELGNPIASQAQSDLSTAYNYAAGQPVSETVSGNLGGQTLPPGVYFSTSSLAISSGDLVLDGQGNTNAVWIFQMASTLTTTAGRQVVLSNGAAAANVFWQVGSSATLGTSSVFYGTIMAYTSITFDTGATLQGRALAENGEVILNGNSISNGLPMVLSFGPTIRAIDGAVTLIITNTPNFPLTLQISTDLIHWTNLTTFTPNASPYTFTDTSPSGQTVRFYRGVY